MNCSDVGPDLVALALGSLTPAESASLEAHVAACAACQVELAAARALAKASREAPGPELSADGETRLFAALRAERGAPPIDVPQPTTKVRRAARIVSIVFPFAAAAAVLVAFVLSRNEPSAEVIDGEGFFRADPGTSAPEVALRGKFEFADGREIAASRAPFTVRLVRPAGAAVPSPGQPQAGFVELKLLPMAHVRRVGPGAVELVGGSIEVAAGPLDGSFTVRAGRGRDYAVVKGTRFLATTADDRLVIVVREGAVELGREGGPSERLVAGEQGLVDAERLLRRPADARGAGDTLLTPRIELAAGSKPLEFEASLTVGEGGPVTIQAFDDADPRFFVRVHANGVPDREIKLQAAMLTSPPPAREAGAIVRLAPGAPYRLAFSLAGIGLPPGSCRANIRYTSYRHRGEGAEWLGVVESEPVDFEVGGK